MTATVQMVAAAILQTPTNHRDRRALGSEVITLINQLVVAA